MKKMDSTKYQNVDLVALLEYTTTKLEEKNVKLHTAREKLRTMKKQVSKMKTIVRYQRERIIQLYGVKPESAQESLIRGV